MTVDKRILHQRIQSLKNLPPLPLAIQKIGQMVDDPRVTTQQLSDVISKDQGLSSRVLHLVNSPIYGFPGRIADIPRAVTLLGFNVIKSLAFGTFVSGIMTKEMHGLWEHSLGVSMAAGILARKIGYGKAEEASVAGLLHDIGKVALKVILPTEYKSALQKVRADRCFIIEAEQAILGEFDHCHMGAELCTRWNLPGTLRDAILHHHAPARARQDKELAAIVHLSDVLVRAFGFGFAGDPFVPPLEKKAWEMLKLTWDGVEEVCRNLESELDKVREIFQPVRH